MVEADIIILSVSVWCKFEAVFREVFLFRFSSPLRSHLRPEPTFATAFEDSAILHRNFAAIDAKTHESNSIHRTILSRKYSPASFSAAPEHPRSPSLAFRTHR